MGVTESPGDRLVIDELNKTYRVATGDVPALRDINLAIAEGEFVSIVGSSGCGKSTLLRIIAGLENGYA